MLRAWISLPGGTDLSAQRGVRVVPAALAVALVLAASLALPGSTGAQTASGPTAANGQPVQIVAQYVYTPTSFAWGDGTMFIGEGPSLPNYGPGGLVTVARGDVKAVPNGPTDVYGLAWEGNSLYVSTGPTIIALSGWNGTSFASDKTIYANPSPSFNGFGGIAFGPDGRLYAGLLAKEPAYDHTKDPFPLSQAVVSMKANGSDLRIVARGLRQPFQLHFPAGSRYPYVSDLGADYGAPATIPRDQIVVAKPGQNYGFPSCIWMPAQANVCRKFNKPLIFLPKHTSPMGISSIAKTLYVALYTGLPGVGPEVVTIPTSGGPVKPFVTGFDSPIISLAVQDGYVYIGEQGGTIYRVYS
jgi:glucose/arabinose dehydrogenase